MHFNSSIFSIRYIDNFNCIILQEIHRFIRSWRQTYYICLRSQLSEAQESAWDTLRRSGSNPIYVFGFHLRQQKLSGNYRRA